MKKILKYIIGVAALTACSSEDLPYVMPDNYKEEITFAVGAVINNEPGSRVDVHTHSIPYHPDKHPQSLGVFGYAKNHEAIYENERFTFNTTWKDVITSNVKYWNSYVEKKPVYFVGYLYDSATLPSADVAESQEGDITLTITGASLPKPVLLSTDAALDKAPLVCCKPAYTETVLPTVNFDMDRTLTGYNVWFMLGETMNNVRDFVVKSVKVSGSAPTTGTIQAVYSKTDGQWTKTTAWGTLGGETAFSGVALSWKDAENKDMTLQVNTHDKYLKWGDENNVASQSFFVIPSASFNPTITVKYDVVLNEPDDKVVTRKDVVSTIVLNSTNFNGLAQGATGKVNPIKIKIVPNYLYVLADKDQATGYLKLN